MDQNIMDLLEDINFELDPIFVIKLGNVEKEWFLERMEFDDGFVRKIFWTQVPIHAMHFHDYDDVLAFAGTQFGDRSVVVKELI